MEVHNLDITLFIEASRLAGMDAKSRGELESLIDDIVSNTANLKEALHAVRDAFAVEDEVDFVTGYLVGYILASHIGITTAKQPLWGKPKTADFGEAFTVIARRGTEIRRAASSRT